MLAELRRTLAEPVLGNIMAWMNGLNTLLMTGWFVGLYQTVLGELSGAVFQRARCLTFHLLLLQPNTAAPPWLDFCTQTRTLPCHAGFILCTLRGEVRAL